MKIFCASNPKLLRIFRKSILLTAFILFNSNSLYSQHFSDAKIKSAYIVQFAQNILWPNENEIDTFHFAILSQNQTYIDEFFGISKVRSVKEKPIHISVFKHIDEIKPPFPELLFVDDAFNDILKKIFEMVGNSPTLVITSESGLKELVMINFLYQDNQKRRLTFELNSVRIEVDANLSILPRLLLLGGSKIDVAELYLKQEAILKDERDKVDMYKKEIEVQEQTIRNQSVEIQKQKDELVVQQKEVAEQKKNLDSLINEVNQQQHLVSNNLLLISRYQADIENQREKMDLQVQEMEKRNRILEIQKLEIENQQERIDSQKDVLNQQAQRIETQRNLLLFSFIAVFLTIGMLFFMYRSFHIKKRANKILEEKNRDIEQKNSEIVKQKEELQKQAKLLAQTNKELENLSLVASKTDNGVIILSPNGDVEWINQGFTRLTGYTLNDLHAENKRNIFDISSFEMIKEVFNNCIINKQSTIYENKFLSKTGQDLWLQTTLTPIENDNGEVVKVTVIDTNITELKKAHQETISMMDEVISQAELIHKQNTEILSQRESLEKAQKQLLQAEKMASIGVLTAGIAHEINNPINFVYAGVNSIMRDFLDVDQVLQIIRDIETSNLKPEEAVKRIIDKKREFDFDEAYKAIGITINDILLGAQRTAEIVQGLRNFSRSETEEFTTTNINKIIQGVLVLLRNKYKHHVEIVNNLDTDLPDVECKMGKMNQVLMNLISNAIDAIKEKGLIEISTKRNGDNCIISVKDNGMGISEEVLPKIFDPFFTTKDVGQGTGLGLAISYGIIEEHNGTIEVHSKVNEGTLFTITIPLKQ